MRTIVLGSGVNALGMVRSLGEAGHRVVTFAVGGERPNRAFQSRYVEKDCPKGLSSWVTGQQIVLDGGFTAGR